MSVVGCAWGCRGGWGEAVCTVTLQLPRLVLRAGRVSGWMVHKSIAFVVVVKVVWYLLANLTLSFMVLISRTLCNETCPQTCPHTHCLILNSVPELLGATYQYNLEDLGTSVISISKKAGLYLDASKSAKCESQVPSVSTNHFRSSTGDRPSRRCAGNAVDVKVEYR